MHEFCFRRVPATWQGQWEAIRAFTRVWHQVHLEPSQSTRPELDRAAALTECPLPGSVEEWIKFSSELRDQGKFGILRDDFRVERLSEHSALTLLAQSEGDFYWAIQDRHLSDPNPPIAGYILDYDSPDERFECMGEVAPTLTGFVLGHMTAYVYSRGGGFAVNVDADSAWMTELETSFEVSMAFGQLRIFENPGIIAFLYDDIWDSEQQRVQCHVLETKDISAVPDCLLKHTKNGGAFYGQFAPV